MKVWFATPSPENIGLSSPICFDWRAIIEASGWYSGKNIKSGLTDLIWETTALKSLSPEVIFIFLTIFPPPFLKAFWKAFARPSE